jgi:L-threonylcarbamoyladenylate synthase
MTTIAPANSPEQVPAAAAFAAKLLRAGEVVAVPTETVYGLAADAHNAEAVKRIFEIKGRPARNPVIVHVGNLEMARACASSWSALAEKLARAFWPGPITLVLPKASSIPPVVTAGGQTVGIRWPAHPVVQAIILECQFPLAAPSANMSGRVSPTTAEHVRKAFHDRIPLIVDGGPSSVGIESTVLDISETPPRVLRPGMIGMEALLSVIEEVQSGPLERDPIMRSPGLLLKHYSPVGRLVIWSWRDQDELRSRVSSSGIPAGQAHIIAHTQIAAPTEFGAVSVLPREPEAYARAIYAQLHRCDEAGAGLIIIEELPGSPEWCALADRLRRAAG